MDAFDYTATRPLPGVILSNARESGSLNPNPEDRVKITSPVLALSLVSVLGACSQSTIKPTSFSPQYQTQLDNADIVIARRCASLSGVDVENGLASRVVGKRTLESKAVPAQDINMTGDLAGWVRASSHEMLKRAQLKVNDPQGPRLKIRLAGININENVYVNSGYDASVILDAALSNAREECWRQRKTGESKNYGHSGTAMAYQETVDHALDRAIMSIVADKTFQDAACGSCKN